MSSDQKLVCPDNPGQNIWNKIEKSSKIEKDKKNLITIFACFLTANCQSLISGERMSPPNFEIYLIFPNFPTS